MYGPLCGLDQDWRTTDPFLSEKRSSCCLGRNKSKSKRQNHRRKAIDLQNKIRSSSCLGQINVRSQNHRREKVDPTKRSLLFLFKYIAFFQQKKCCTNISIGPQWTPWTVHTKPVDSGTQFKNPWFKQWKIKAFYSALISSETWDGNFLCFTIT